MNFKSILFSFLIVTSLSVATPFREARAGAVILVGSIPTGIATGNILIPIVGVPVGALIFGIGGVVAFFSPMVGVPMMILSEDGTISKDQMESILTQKYDFISDREVIKDLASALISKKEKGKSLLSLSEEEIKTILAPLDISENETNIVVNDFK